MSDDPIEDAAHPTGTHAVPGSGDEPAADGRSGEEEIVDGRNPTQRRIDEESAKDGTSTREQAHPGS
jgi:hypothetical protein